MEKKPTKKNRKRIREPLIQIRADEEDLEEHIYVAEKSRASKKQCVVCGAKMVKSTYTNNFGDVLPLFRCSECPHIDIVK